MTDKQSKFLADLLYLQDTSAMFVEDTRTDKSRLETCKSFLAKYHNEYVEDKEHPDEVDWKISNLLQRCMYLEEKRLEFMKELEDLKNLAKQ